MLGKIQKIKVFIYKYLFKYFFILNIFCNFVADNNKNKKQ